MTFDEILEDIKTNPTNHHHSFEDLRKCCFVAGAINFLLLDAHAKYAPVGFNVIPCDVIEGPCNCGAWHKK